MKETGAQQTLYVCLSSAVWGHECYKHQIANYNIINYKCHTSKAILTRMFLFKFLYQKLKESWACEITTLLCACMYVCLNFLNWIL